MKKTILFLFLLLSVISYSQENCNNGVDDDGDGKIDLNDPDCVCNTSSITSIIPNPSFEANSGCPSSFSQLNLATPWIQATDATSDYHNLCGYIFPSLQQIGLQNFPNGNGTAGGYFVRNWNEYLGTTLISSLNAGTNYQLTFDLAMLFTNSYGELATDRTVGDLEPVNVTLYGCANGTNLPISTTFSPNTADSTWIEIGHATYTPLSSWGQLTISFNPTFNVNAIMLGSPPVLPPSFPSIESSNSYPYMVYDNLLLNTSAAFGINISQTGYFCENNLVLQSNLTIPVASNATYQWYHNGIAIVGATSSTYNVPSIASNLGNYSVKVTNGSSCYVSSSITINNSLPSPTYTSVQPNCLVVTGSITITTPSSQYSFDNGLTWQNSPTKSNLPVGNYFIKVKSANGCVSTGTGVIIQEPQLLGNSDYIVTQPTTCNGTGSITITSTIAAQYSFDNGLTWVTNATANNLQPGFYEIKIKDAAGCQSSTQGVYIYQVFLPFPTYTLIQPTCGTGGGITITTTGTEYSFDDGVTWSSNNNISNLIPGYYSIRIKNAQGCISDSQSVYLEPFLLNIIPTFTVIEPTCGSSGSITITTPGTEFSFDNGATWSTNPVLNNVISGNYYYIIIKNNLGCQSQTSYIYITPFFLNDPTFTVTQPGCAVGGSITITSVSSEYSFDGGVTWSTNATASNLQPGYYYVMIKNSLGCTSNYIYVYLDYFLLPSPTFVAVNPSCNNIGSITITSVAAEYSFDGGGTWTTNNVANNLQAGYYYIMIKNSLGCTSSYITVYMDGIFLADPNYILVQPTCTTGGSITITTPATQYSFDGGTTWVTNPVSNNLQPGYYYIMIKNAAGCTSSNYLYLFIDTFYLPTPTFELIEPSCGNTGSITITSVNDFYSFDNGTTWVTNPVLTNLEAGYYYVKVKNNLGCESQYIYIYVNPIYLPEPNYTSTQPTCGVGGSITITTPSDFYSFDNGATWGTFNTLSNLLPNTYIIKIKSSSGCESYGSPIYINQFYLPTPTYTITQPTCSVGGSITVTSSATEYSFDNGATWSTNSTLNNLFSGYYYIKIRNSLGCVSDYEFVYINSITILDPPTVQFTNPTICGTNNGSITISSFAYQYSFDNGVTWVFTNSLSNLSDGTYSIKIKDSLNGCPSQATSVTLTGSGVIPLPPTYTSVQPTCTISTGSITITSTSAQYSFDNGVTWQTTASLSNLSSGTYSVKIKNAGGCVSQPTTVILNPVTIIAAPSSTTIQPSCTNSTGSITITTSANQYSFDNGTTWLNTSTLSSLSSGTYSIKIKDANGCISLPTAVVLDAITILATPAFTVVQPSCTNSTGSITITTSAIQYSYDNGATWSSSSVLSNLSSGTYSIKIKDSNGCVSLSTSAVINTVSIPSTPVLSVIQPLCGVGGTITVTTSAFQYSFDNGATWVTSNSLSNLNDGTYKIKIRQSVTGCSSLASSIVLTTTGIIPTAPTFTTVQPSCTTTTGTITVTTSATQYSFDNGVTWLNVNSQSNLSSGNYLIKIKNSAGCISSSSLVALTPVVIPIAPTYTSIQPICGIGGSITITASAFEYSFDNGATWSTSNILSNLSDGNYSIKIKQSSIGCPSIASTVVLNGISNLPAPNFTTIQPTCTVTTGSITITTSATQYSFDNGATWGTGNGLSNLSSGNYNIKIKNNTGCISLPTTVVIDTIAIPLSPTYSSVQPLCGVGGSITITTTAFQYSYDDGLSWVSNNILNNVSSGSYFIRIKNSLTGCPSLSTLVTINAPINAPNAPSFSVVQPITCSNAVGTITITSSAFEYSFDNGLNYSANNISSLLSPGTYFIRVKNNVGCESSPVQVVINNPTNFPPTPIFTILQPDCSNTKGQITVTTVATEYSFDNGVTWSPNSISIFLNPGNYTIKIKNSLGCISIGSLAVINSFTNFPSLPTVVSPQTFCLLQNATLNSITISGQNITWYHALTGGTILPLSTILQNNITYFASQTISGCEGPRKPVAIIINNTATPTATATQSFCSNTNPNLSNVTIIGTNINWYASANSSSVLPNSTSLQNGSTYYASQTINGCESLKIAITINLINTLNANNYSVYLCDDLNDGSEIIDISSYNTDLISSTNNLNFSYYYTSNGATNQTITDLIPTITNYSLTVGQKIIYVRLVSSSGCSQIVELQLNLFSKPIISIADTMPLCKATLLTLDAGTFDSYSWSTGETSQIITIATAGNYSVTVGENFGNIICYSTKNFTIVSSEIAVLSTIETLDWNQNQNVISVFLTNPNAGNYEYSLDGMNFQDSSVFSGLFAGSYTIYVRDKNGCGVLETDAYLLNYPAYFTPNGDGFHELWKVRFSELEPGLKTEIFDRYGKILKVLGSNSSGWDGTYNGNMMISDDYWFVVTRTNGKIHKGHFTLKR